MCPGSGLRISQQRTVLVAGGTGSGKTTLIDAPARVLALVANHMKFAHVRDMCRSRLRRFVEQPDFKDHLELHRFDCLSGHGLLDSHGFAQQHYEQVQAEGPFVALLTGRDLIGAGYEPGPVFGKVLAEVRELQHEGVLADREQALAFAGKRVAAPS